MEKLNLDYELKVYKRGPDLLAPKELKKVWPTGLSPLLQVFKEGSTKPLTLAESGQIILYLIRHYDTTKEFTPDNDEDEELVNYYLHFAEGTLQPLIVSLLVGSQAVKRAPFGFGGLVKVIISRINDGYYLLKLLNHLAFLDNQLKDKNGGYFVGNKLSGADFILDFPVSQNLFIDAARMKDLGVNINAIKDYPNLYAWHKLTVQDPARVKARQAEESAIAKL